MKINYNFKNPDNKQKSSSVSFEAGMTPAIKQKILDTDVIKISNNLAKKGIDSDFQGNKTIAWCANKIVEIFEQINQFGTKIMLPRGIYVNDFQKLNIENSKNTNGFCNLFQTYLYKNSDEIVDGEVVLFNNHNSDIKEIPNKFKWLYDWSNINEISDLNYALGNLANPHFLGIFLHEFAHVAHEENMLDNMSVEKLLEKMQNILLPENIAKYQSKHGKETANNICTYAMESPLEAIACDMSKKMVLALDEDLNLTKNPFAETFYENKTTVEKQNKGEFPVVDMILKNIWNGKFE